MKASELIEQLRLVAAHGVACGIMKETATMLERFVALANELDRTGEAGSAYFEGWNEGLEHAAKRIREILEET